MDMGTLKMAGDYGCYVDENSVISFQIGERPSASAPAIDPTLTEAAGLAAGEERWLGVRGFQVYCRGANNLKCEEIARDIKRNRLLPRLISKQVAMLYGHGPAVYVGRVEGGRPRREWVDCPRISDWLHGWRERGVETDCENFAKAVIKNFYYFRDFFVKWRFAAGKGRPGTLPVAGLEAMENKDCRLATTRRDAAVSLVRYRDFRHVAVGRWATGTGAFSFYPKYDPSEAASYRWAAISHHREKTVGDFYGLNETHEGTRAYIRGSNGTADYINSFLRNSLAAKVHIVIPNAWIESKRTQIAKLCDENKKRRKEGLEPLVYNGLEIGTEYRESTLVRYLQSELRKISAYLTGSDNQGKAYATVSFKNAQGEEERWKIETVDLKYREYIDALISYDKRADEVLLSSVGLDASISSVSKDGVISKSGSDAYYNYLIYLLSLTAEDEICCEPFNEAVALNFPDLYAEGYRVGFYREVPARQEDVSPQDRLNRQQS